LNVEIQEDVVSDESWNDHLLHFLGTVYQTKEYAKFTESARNWESRYLKFVNSNGQIVGQLMLNVYSKFENRKIGSILKKLTPYDKHVYRWLYGPVVFDPNSNHDICNALKKYLVSKKCTVSGSEHPLSNGNLSSLGEPFTYKSWGTFLIDLSQGKEILWSKLDKHSAKKNIERSQERGVDITEMKKSDLIGYHKMLHDTKLKAGGYQHLSRLEKLWEILHPIGLTGFMAYENEQPVGGIMVSSFNGYINEWGVARSERDTVAKLYSQDLLKWKIIEWGIENKYRYYDLSGVNPDPKDQKEIGIYKYKKKWGGELIKYGMVTL